MALDDDGFVTDFLGSFGGWVFVRDVPPDRIGVHAKAPGDGALRLASGKRILHCGAVRTHADGAAHISVHSTAAD
jgi:hypothetical protein